MSDKPCGFCEGKGCIVCEGIKVPRFIAEGFTSGPEMDAYYESRASGYISPTEMHLDKLGRAEAERDTAIRHLEAFDEATRNLELTVYDRRLDLTGQAARAFLSSMREKADQP